MSASPSPIQLLSLPLSAYRPTLALDHGLVYLLTDNSAYRLAPGEAGQRFALDLGVGAALTRSSFVFWSQGVVYRAPKEGGTTSRVCAYPHQPQYFVSSDDERFAWIDRAEDGAFTIQTASAGRAQTLLAPAGQIAIANMLGDWVFFVEISDSGWRIGATHEPGKAVYSAPHSGRPPSTLSVDTVAQKLFYYDVDRYAIVELWPDLQREQPWVENVICSPIAVAGSAYCGSVEGLYSVSNTNPKPTPLMANSRSMVTRIAADTARVVYVRDVGADQLSVEMIPLSKQ